MDVMNNQQGYLSIVMVIFITIIAGLCVGAAYLLTVAGNTNTNSVSFTKAFYLAESGVQRAQRMILNPALSGSANRSTCASFSVTDTATLNPPGEYSAIQSTTSGLVYAVSTTTSGTITTGSTTIPVVSSSGYASSGRIRIDKEFIDYAAISGNSFVGLNRGVDNTTVAAHASGVGVAQFQCNIQGKGGVPTIASPAGLATINAGLQMQEGWATGDSVNATTETFFHWNYPTEKTWNAADAVLTNAVNLSGMYVLSNADIWVVGAAQGSNMFALHWNGSNWTRVLPSPAINKDYVAVFCNASDDCWAVGGRPGSGKIFAHYTGSPPSWVEVNSASLAQLEYNAVFCNSVSDCWAVGSGPGFGRYTGGATWVNVATENIPSVEYFGLWCNASNDCWAVGKSGGGGQVVILRWNGITWARDPSTPTPVVALNAVTCTNTNDCWAVGDADNNNAVFEHWNGTNWTSTTLNTGTANAHLYAVSCFTTDDCWAVGNQGGKFHWDGSAWSMITTPSASLKTLRAIGLVGSKKFPLSSWVRG